MDTETKSFYLDASDAMDYWRNIPVEDIVALKLYQKIEYSIHKLVDLLEVLESAPRELSNKYLVYIWSGSVRDFVVLLRDSLLATGKYEQFVKDSNIVDDSYLYNIQSLIQNAAKTVLDEFYDNNKSKEELDEWKYQKGPVSEILLQIHEIQKQNKKIYRSFDKVDDIRFNIIDYVRDFQLQYSIQTTAISNLYSHVEQVEGLSKSVSAESTDVKINNVVDQIGDSILKVEMIQGTESIEIFPYSDKEVLSIPVSTSEGSLIYKTINVKYEFARWFSSFIYLKVIELESKRDQAVEKSLLVFRQIQAKIAALSIEEVDKPEDIQHEFDQIFNQLQKDIIGPLSKEEEENKTLVLGYIDKYLKASQVYSDDVLFLPDTGNSQISNLSKDAQKRFTVNFEKYKNQFKLYVYKVLSRYIEIDKTQYSQFIKNKLCIDDEDDGLALFLKNGYLGKSFTVARPQIIEPIIEDYRLWNDGFSGAILLSGVTGSGKTTILGKLNHKGLNHEIIQLKTHDSYFIEHRSYEPVIDLKELIEKVIKKTRGRKVVLCIDDLEQWHNEEIGLFDNLNKLFNSISKHKKRIFFIVTCSPFLKDRIKVFKDLDPVFSSQLEVGRMNSNQIKNALNLRTKVNEIKELTEIETEAGFRHIVRESKGNPGMAMLEYCRLHDKNYISNIKSQAFTELIKNYSVLLTYINSYHHCSVKFLSSSLSEIDFKNTIRIIEHLVGQKVLIRPKKGYVAINPHLIHNVEKVLLKLKK